MTTPSGVTREERQEKYWICDECAKAKGWTAPNYQVPYITKGLCGHCERQDATKLMSTCDYRKPAGIKTTKEEIESWMNHLEGMFFGMITASIFAFTFPIWFPIRLIWKAVRKRK